MEFWHAKVDPFHQGRKVSEKKTAIIIGAGPAGLTAAYELLARAEIVPLVFEMSDQVGGISRTVKYKGNRIDIGGHRFFSKNQRVMDWWLLRLPLQTADFSSTSAVPHSEWEQNGACVEDLEPNKKDRVMLLRKRKSSIYFLRQFFDYPLRVNPDTLKKLGVVRMLNIAFSYAHAVLFSKRNPTNLEEFFISRFGRKLYVTFFRSYTEKVWGESCSNISAGWGAQRVKGLSITKLLAHFVRGLLRKDSTDFAQKATETSLIEQFLYPKFGPGQMWEVVADEVRQLGGKLFLNHRITKVHVEGDLVTSVDALDVQSGRTETYRGDYVFSTMPVRELIESLDTPIPSQVREVASGLIYRDFITVGLLVNRLKVTERQDGVQSPIRDNWIYIQEPEVLLGRLQIFNNWSPYLVANPEKTWIGLEYFCYETDPLWQHTDEEMIQLGTEDLARIGIIDPVDVLDGTVIRMPKTYPAYFGTYDRFEEIRAFADRFTNLFLVGRNGMHRYNNQDHSMLTAMVAVDNILAAISDKTAIWEVNAEQEYHESGGVR
jgi:protoporphyrinogen oxidase